MSAARLSLLNVVGSPFVSGKFYAYYTVQVFQIGWMYSVIRSRLASVERRRNGGAVSYQHHAKVATNHMTVRLLF